MPASIDLAALAAIVVVLWMLTVIFRLTSNPHLYLVFRRALITAVVIGIIVFCWNVATAWR